MLDELPIARIADTCWSSSVYEPSDDSFLLVDALQEHAPGWRATPPVTVAEIGCGSGYVICSVAAMLRSLDVCAQLVAIDINPEAAASTQRTLGNHGITNVEIILTDLIKGLGSQILGHIDVLIFNPPYVPTPDEEVTQNGIARAWAGGHRGRVVIDRLLERLPDMLSASGQLFMVTVAENDPKGIIEEMGKRGFAGRTLLTRQADEETLSIVHLQRLEP